MGLFTSRQRCTGDTPKMAASAALVASIESYREAMVSWAMSAFAAGRSGLQPDLESARCRAAALLEAERRAFDGYNSWVDLERWTANARARPPHLVRTAIHASATRDPSLGAGATDRSRRPPLTVDNCSVMIAVAAERAEHCMRLTAGRGGPSKGLRGLRVAGSGQPLASLPGMLDCHSALGRSRRPTAEVSSRRCGERSGPGLVHSDHASRRADLDLADLGLHQVRQEFALSRARSRRCAVHLRTGHPFVLSTDASPANGASV
jgi:hypothetical protein